MEQVQIGNEGFFKISDSDKLRPFFMSIVSDSDHWMFISSNGGLSAGRKNTEYSLFPYYTDDKITESAEITGSKTIVVVHASDAPVVWEPFSDRNKEKFHITRNLYKSVYGNKILFEEVNHDLELKFSYQWNSSDRYGFVRKSSLVNLSDQQIKVSVLDGVQNLIPYGVGSDLQNRQSNLVDAYKRSELIEKQGVGIYALSAIIVDRAEPSEALKANIAWSVGLNGPKYLLSSLQLHDFRTKYSVRQETDVKAEKGAYLLNFDLSMGPKSNKDWMIVLNVNQNHGSIAKIVASLGDSASLVNSINADIENGTKQLIGLTAASDGLQYTSDSLRDTRHFSNTLFNIMRGGIFDDGYRIEKWDFTDYLSKANKEVYQNAANTIAELPETFTLATLKKITEQSTDRDLVRLCLEYMPLKFSRRHGDPSRPWNRFSINTRSEVDGSKILDYEGNWRDIFQNWEALAHSYPEFIENMIHKFLNATTFDGYNPYRITKGGFDWEIVEPDDPWSYIGYWGDHQIIYLLKFLEFIQDHYPGKLEGYFDKDLFVYANVPYKIKSFEEIVNDPKDTIEFDDEQDKSIRHRRTQLGADGALLTASDLSIHRANFLEKILATVLSKLSNLVPEGGIWMNTQRPEWNDANNALVGNGVSMVTLYYLRRFLKFFEELLDGYEVTEVPVSNEVGEFFENIRQCLDGHRHLLSKSIEDKERYQIVAQLGQAGSMFRSNIYENSFSGEQSPLLLDDLKHTISVALEFLEHSISANKRQDGMYHAYNLMTINENQTASISYLSEMLEGQVAVLSSGYLTAEQNLEVLDGLKKSKLFRPDQYSYLLYPNKELPSFMDKNTVPEKQVKTSELLSALVHDGNLTIIEKDVNGAYHFNGDFKNATDLERALLALSNTPYAHLANKESGLLHQIFEEVFNHKAFTGRSGTFYGYEGLGSIYWHMVSKLLLAVVECSVEVIGKGSNEIVVGKLLEHFYEINEGIGVHKSPELYGAFPTDPYSHTPAGKGAQQPGMTGQVKEDILSRFGELGVFVADGRLKFDPVLLRKSEFLEASTSFHFVDVNEQQRKIQLEKNSLCFTYCQVPIIYNISEEETVVVLDKNNNKTMFDSLSLDLQHSIELFKRSDEIRYIIVNLKETRLR
ncbi:hypothetical protein [Flagellimonas sp.]|uniref:hypothetical protein n=1 Tax=Flagellimonas sp. TaxID=2058762 RepID=UPI003B5254AC